MEEPTFRTFAPDPLPDEVLLLPPQPASANTANAQAAINANAFFIFMKFPPLPFLLCLQAAPFCRQSAKK